MLAKSYRPNWNDVRIVQAMLATAGEALKRDPKTTHVLFCTESCIPITSLQEAAETLAFPNRDKPITANGTAAQHTETPCLDYSFVSAYNGSSSRCTRFDERSCWSKLVGGGIPHDAIWKALPGWCLLSRKHMQAILDMPSTYLEHDNLWPVFDEVWAPEEVFFPTALSLLGFLPSEEVVLRSLTHSKWPKASDAHPIEYDGKFSERLVRELRREEGCLFLRKVKCPMNVKSWERIVLACDHANNPATKDDSFSTSHQYDRKRQYRSDHDDRQQNAKKNEQYSSYGNNGESKRSRSHYSNYGRR
jgi:hypothetical protein